MRFELTIRYLVALIYAFVNILTISKTVESFRDRRFGYFGWFVSASILNILLMVRIIFVENW